MWATGEAVVSALADVDRALGEETHFKDLAYDLLHQRIVGALTWMKFTELMPRLYAEYGYQVGFEFLRAVSEATTLFDQAAVMKHFHLQSAQEVWGGCTEECFSGDSVAETAPHWTIFQDAFGGNRPRFLADHSATTYWESAQFGLFWPGPLPWPITDFNSVPAPSIAGKEGDRTPTLQLPPIAAGGCPATLFETIRGMVMTLSQAVYCDAVMGHAVRSAWTSFERSDRAARVIDRGQFPPSQLLPSSPHPRLWRGTDAHPGPPRATLVRMGPALSL